MAHTQRFTRKWLPRYTANDSANLQTEIDAMAGKGEVVILPGDGLLTTRITMPTNTVVSAHPNTTLYSRVARVDGYTGATFFFPSGQTGAQLGLASANTVGGETLSLTALGGLVEEGWVQIVVEDAISAVQYLIKEIAGAGPFTITTERPILYAFLATAAAHGAKVYRSVPRERVFLYGNGATIIGAGDRAFEAIGSIDSVFEDWKLVSATENGVAGYAGFMASFDNGGLRNTFRRIIVDANDQAIAGLALETQEMSVIEDCDIRNVVIAAGNSSVYVYESHDCAVKDTRVSDGNYGISIDYQSSATRWMSSSAIKVNGCKSQNNAVAGYWISGGASVELTDCSGLRNTDHGLRVDNGTVVSVTSATTSIRAKGSRFDNNTAGGIIVSSGNVDLVGCTADNNASYGIDVAAAAASVTFEGLQCRGNTTQAVLSIAGKLSGTGLVCENGLYGLYIAGGDVSVSGVARTTTTPGYIAIVFYGGALRLHSFVFDGAGGGGAPGMISHTTAGTIWMDNVRATGTWTNGYVTVTGHATFVWKGNMVDLSIATTPWTVPDESQANFGNFTLAGAASVTVNCRGIKASSRPGNFVAYDDNGGVPGASPLLGAIVANTSFAVSGTAGDTRKCRYLVEPT